MGNSVADLVKAAWEYIRSPVKWFGLPVAFLAVLGLIFNTMLARTLGFDSPDTFVIGDQVTSGLLLLWPTLRQFFLLALCVAAAAATVVLAVFLWNAWFRIAVWGRRALIRLRAKFSRGVANYLKAMSLEDRRKRLEERCEGLRILLGSENDRGAPLDWWQRVAVRNAYATLAIAAFALRVIDTSRDWLRGRLWRDSDRGFKRAAAVRREHGFIDEDGFGLGGVWRGLLDDMRRSFGGSWEWISAGSAYAVVAVGAFALLFAAHIAVDAAKGYADKVKDYATNALGRPAAGAESGMPVGSADAAEGGATTAAAASAPSTAWNGFYPVKMLESLEGAINHASQRPRLVSLLLTGQSTYLRPMMLIAQFSDELVLYDFFGDDDPDDDRLFPIRTLDPAKVAMIVSAETSLPVPAGVAPRKSAVRGIIEAACIEPGAAETPPPPQTVPAAATAAKPAAAPPGAAVAAEAPTVAQVPAAVRPWRAEWDDIRRTLIKGDGVNCGSKAAAPPPDRPLVIEIGDRLAARLDGSGGIGASLKAAGSVSDRLSEVNDTLAAIAGHIATAAPVPGVDSAFAQSLDAVSASLADLASAVRDVPMPSETAPAIEPPPVTTNYFITRIDSAGIGSAYRGRWDDCSDLASWTGSNGIRFANGRFGLDGPRNNDLELGTGAADPIAAWERLIGIFKTWSEQVKQAADGKRAFVFLIGRATERGRPGFNLELTEDRAAAVKTALLSTAAETRWSETGIEPDWIIAIGEGETALVPGEVPTDEGTRRVDAKICFG